MSSESTPDTGQPAESELAAMLPRGMSEQAFLDAIVVSGYPLQTVVATTLEDRDARVTEEWAYQDLDSAVRRAIDVAGHWQIQTTPTETDRGRSTVALAVLIECKQSRYPYVFFEAVNPPDLGSFPPVVGLGNGRMQLTPDVEPGRFSIEVPMHRFLELTDEPLIVTPTVVSSISKATPKGKRVELSGDEPYNSLLLPLTKAIRVYSARFSGARNSGQWHDVRLPIALVVADAPMILVGTLGQSAHPSPTTWVRVIVRRAVVPDPQSRWRNPLAFDVVDIVHRAFLTRYLDDYALPFAQEFAKRFTMYHEAALSGSARIRGLSQGEPLPDELLAALVEPIG
jgi:hypothetical protein